MEITSDAVVMFPKTKSMSFKEAVTVTDDALENLPRTLMKLNLGWCDKITDNGLENLPQTLMKLNLVSCNGIIGDGLKNLPFDHSHKFDFGKLISLFRNKRKS